MLSQTPAETPKLLTAIIVSDSKDNQKIFSDVLSQHMRQDVVIIKCSDSKTASKDLVSGNTLILYDTGTIDKKAREEIHDKLSETSRSNSNNFQRKMEMSKDARNIDDFAKEDILSSPLPFLFEAHCKPDDHEATHVKTFLPKVIREQFSEYFQEAPSPRVEAETVIKVSPPSTFASMKTNESPSMASQSEVKLEGSQLSPRFQLPLPYSALQPTISVFTFTAEDKSSSREAKQPQNPNFLQVPTDRSPKPSLRAAERTELSVGLPGAISEPTAPLTGLVAVNISARSTTRTSGATSSSRDVPPRAVAYCPPQTPATVGGYRESDLLQIESDDQDSCQCCCNIRLW